MSQSLFVFVLLIGIFEVLSQFNDEYYCRRVPGQYKICRSCPTLEESCERPTHDRCECENIELQANADSMWQMSKKDFSFFPQFLIIGFFKFQLN